MRKRSGWPDEGGAPAHDTFGDLFGVLDTRAFEARFRAWINALAGVVEGVVAIDGKTVRGWGKKDKKGSDEPRHRVNAHAAHSRPVLAQESTCGKGHEPAGTKASLEPQNLEGKEGHHPLAHRHLRQAVLDEAGQRSRPCGRCSTMDTDRGPCRRIECDGGRQTSGHFS